MSFREKIAWASLGTTLAIYAAYFALVFGTPAGSTVAGVFQLLSAAIALQTLAMIGLSVWFVTQGRLESADERDRAIDTRAYRNAYFVLAPGAVLACLYATAGNALSESLRPGLLVVGNFLLLCFVLAELVKFATQVVHYRRS